MSLEEPPAVSAAAEARRLLKPFQDELVTLAAELVRANTVNLPPRGSEAAGQSVLERFFSAHGLRAELYAVDEILAKSNHPGVRRDRDYKGRQNLSLRLGGAGRGRSLLLNGHIDTVPHGHAPWSHDPWSSHIEGGKLFGLGSYDMKSGLAAQAMVLVALHSAGVRLAGELLFESVVDEEWGGGGGTLAALLRGLRADAAIVSEGTQLEVLRATRGGFVVDLVVEAGDASAYFSQQAVVSPAVPLSRLLLWIEHWTSRRADLQTTGAYADSADPAPVQVLAIEANRLDRDVPLSVPLRATVRVYFQFLPEEDVAQELQFIRASLDNFARQDAFFSRFPIEWRPLYDPPLLGHELSERHPWTTCLTSAVSQITQQKAVVSAAPYPCDAFLLQREFNIPTLLFGPSGAGAHNPDEYVEIDSLQTAAQSILTAALLWCA